jgi:thiopeptide-type bacteriocin biosynthesis protein
LSKLTLCEPPLVIGRVPFLPIDAIDKLFESGPQPFRTMPIVETAVSLASPDLAAALELGSLSVSVPGSVDSRPSLKLLAYVLRMASRPTPFGLFASVGSAEFGKKTTLAIEEQRSARARADLGWLLAAATALVQDSPEAFGRLRLRASDSVLTQGDRWYFLDDPPDSPDHPSRSGIRATSMRATRLSERLRAAATSWVRADDLAHMLRQEFGVEPARAEALVRRLWASGFLIDELAPSPVGEPIRRVQELLRELAPPGAEGLAECVERIAALSGEVPSERMSCQRLRELNLEARRWSGSRTFVQVDAFHCFSGTLGNRIVHDLRRYVELVARGSFKVELGRLRDEVQQQFEGEGRTIPFLELADALAGSSTFSQSALNTTAPDEKRQAPLLEIVTEACRTGVREVELTDLQLAALYPEIEDSWRFPASFEIGFHVAATSAHAIDEGAFSIWPASLFASLKGGACVGRFADVLCPLDWRSPSPPVPSNGPVQVELVYLPRVRRVGNVATRPALHDHELQIGLFDTSGGKMRLSAADLFVTIDDDRFLLWSRTLGRQIQIVESHMVNTSYVGSFLAKLLNALSTHGTRSFQSFAWGQLRFSPFLPRVRYGRLVLSRARWRVTLPQRRPGLSIHKALAEFANRWNMPEEVNLVEGDNVLPIQWRSRLGKALLDELIHPLQSAITLEEPLPREQHWLRGPGGMFAAEFVCSFSLGITDDTPVGLALSPILLDRTARVGPAADWLYAQLFCAPHRIDTLLRTGITPLIAHLSERQAVSEFFFVRYGHPEHHLRVRFHLVPGSLAESRGEIAEQLERWTLDGTIRRWSVCTYEREFERYGGVDAMKFAEELFARSSEQVLALLCERRIEQPKNAVREAWTFVGALVEAFFDATELHGWLDASRPPVASRKLAPWQRELLKTADRRRSAASVALRDLILEPVLALQRIDREGNLCRPLTDIVSSLVHVHCNRMGLDTAGESQVRTLLWHELFSRVQARRAGNAALDFAGA